MILKTVELDLLVVVLFLCILFRTSDLAKCTNIPSWLRTLVAQSGNTSIPEEQLGIVALFLSNCALSLILFRKYFFLELCSYEQELV